MSEWKDKSDFEINKAVAETQQFTYVIGDGLYPSQSDEAVHVERKTFKYGNIEELGVDYCNNPSDAWPIIIDNRISINHGMTLISDGDYKWHENWFCGNGKGIDCQGKNPLRTAMIVYLEMNGVKP